MWNFPATLHVKLDIRSSSVIGRLLSHRVPRNGMWEDPILRGTLRYVALASENEPSQAGILLVGRSSSAKQWTRVQRGQIWTVCDATYHQMFQAAATSSWNESNQVSFASQIVRSPILLPLPVPPFVPEIKSMSSRRHRASPGARAVGRQLVQEGYHILKGRQFFVVDSKTNGWIVR